MKASPRCPLQRGSLSSLKSRLPILILVCFGVGLLYLYSFEERQLRRPIARRARGADASNQSPRGQAAVHELDNSMGSNAHTGVTNVALKQPMLTQLRNVASPVPVDVSPSPIPQTNASEPAPAYTEIKIKSTMAGCQNHHLREVCSFMAKGLDDVMDELNWGAYSMCDMTDAPNILNCASHHCTSCLTGADVCRDPPRLLFHQLLLNLHPDNWEGNLVSMMSYLMTQDLSKTELIVWTPNMDKVYNVNTSRFFDSFSANIKLRHYNYTELIRGTPFEGDRFFGNETLMTEKVHTRAGQSDLARILLLHKFGGVWMDNDVIMFRDLYPVVVHVGYQFVERWTNNHIMYLVKQSPLSVRLMEIVKTMPMDTPDFEEVIIRDICEPVGYYPMSWEEYGYADIYNACVLRLALKKNNTGSKDAVLYDYPLAWFDQDWVECMHCRKPVTYTEWWQGSHMYLTMHTRYPKNLKGQFDDVYADVKKGSPLWGALRIIKGFFKMCDHQSCIPRGPQLLIDYEAVVADAGLLWANQEVH